MYSTECSRDCNESHPVSTRTTQIAAWTIEVLRFRCGHRFLSNIDKSGKTGHLIGGLGGGLGEVGHEQLPCIYVSRLFILQSHGELCIYVSGQSRSPGNFSCSGAMSLAIIAACMQLRYHMFDIRKL